MPNFINGSRLKKYEMPITTEMIKLLQHSKTYKAGLEQLKTEAQQEARERRQQIRARRHANIMALSINEDKDDEFIVKPFTIHLQLLTASQEQSTIALIDSRADWNVMSYNIWTSLGNPVLVPSKLQFTNFSGTQTTSLGKLCLKVRFKDQSMHIVFHVADKDQASMNIALGRQWMGLTNCQINWTTRHYSLQVNSINLTGQSSELKLPPTSTINASTSKAGNTSVWLQDVDNPTHGW